MSQDRDEIAIEAVLTGEKGMFDCPIRLHIYGTSNPINRLALEEKLKRDKLIKAGELKKTRAEAEAQRKVLGIKGSQSRIGLDGGTAEPEVSLEELAQASQTVQDQHRGDAIKSFVVDEDFLSKMTMAEQPAVLESTLLPYQLQVRSPSCCAQGGLRALRLGHNTKHAEYVGTRQGLTSI